MAAVGGDIIEITWNHPVHGSGTWYPKSGEDSTFDTGGFRGDDDDNGVDGGGRNIKKLNRRRWSFEGTVSWDANISNELEQAELLAADPVDAEWTITHINGTVWGGTGSPVGDIQGSGNDATMAIKISGGQKLKKIVG
jgi:hypothetical protein